MHDPSPRHDETAYRPDIDGLRAVAVLGVVWFHAFPSRGGGGFVGVDVFFVISGYLISSIILREGSAGRFDYAEFYRRRIRRIFPALAVVLAACLLLAAWLALPSASYQIGRHLMAGAGFASNFLLLSEAGYFDGGSATKPLLHLWSLSVEEQYYLCWPPIALLLLRRPRWFPWAVAALLAGSFALNVALVRTRPDAAFYFPAARAWELLAGALLAYASGAGRPRLAARRSRSPLGSAALARLRAAAGWLGAALLAIALARTPEAGFPGWWALLPTLGAVLVIASGPAAPFNRRVLGHRWMVAVGKISYPLYLWHWPLLVFPVIVLGSAPRSARIAAVGASFALAWLTYRYVETPLRRGARTRHAVPALAGAVAAIGVCGLALVLSDGWSARFPPALREVAAAPIHFDFAAYRQHRCFLEFDEGAEKFAEECAAPARPGVERVWLWGDSHAAHLYPGLSALARAGAFDLSQFTAATCPPIEGFPVAPRKHCQGINDLVLRKIAAARPDVVIMAANWSQHDGRYGWGSLDTAALARTAAQLKASGVGRVVVVGQMPRWRVALPDALLGEWKQEKVLPARTARFLNEAALAADAQARQAARLAGVDFFSPIDVLCDTAGCQTTLSVDGKTYPIAWDDAHLTPAASTALVARWQGALVGRPEARKGGAAPAS